MSKSISRRGKTWVHTRAGYITHYPENAGKRYDDAYVAARIGSPEFWCEGHDDKMYRFESLLSGASSAPAYMKTLARRVARDIKEESNEGRG